MEIGYLEHEEIGWVHFKVDLDLEGVHVVDYLFGFALVDCLAGFYYG